MRLLIFLLGLVACPSFADKPALFDLGWEVQHSQWIASGRLTKVDRVDCVGEFGHKLFKGTFVRDDALKGSPPVTIEVLFYDDNSSNRPRSDEQAILLFNTDKTKCGNTLWGAGFLPIKAGTVKTSKFAGMQEWTNSDEFKGKIKAMAEKIGQKSR